MSECKALNKDGGTCINGFRQNDFCRGVGIAAHASSGSFYKLSKIVYPQCTWDDDVTQGHNDT